MAVGRLHPCQAPFRRSRTASPGLGVLRPAEQQTSWRRAASPSGGLLGSCSVALHLHGSASTNSRRRAGLGWPWDAPAVRRIWAGSASELDVGPVWANGHGRASSGWVTSGVRRTGWTSRFRCGGSAGSVMEMPCSRWWSGLATARPAGIVSFLKASLWCNAPLLAPGSGLRGKPQIQV